MNTYIITENKTGAGRYHYTSSDGTINNAYCGFSRTRARRRLAKRFPHIIGRGAKYITK